MRGYREFLYILPFIILVAIFAYYPLYGWAYAFFDYKPPKALSMDDFVGLKWFRYLVDNPVRIKQTLMVLRNTFAMSGLTILFSWLPMIFAVFLNEIKCMPLPEICPDRDDTSKLHQLGTGIFYLLLYVQQYRYGKQLTDTDGST